MDVSEPLTRKAGQHAVDALGCVGGGAVLIEEGHHSGLAERSIFSATVLELVKVSTIAPSPIALRSFHGNLAGGRTGATIPGMGISFEVLMPQIYREAAAGPNCWAQPEHTLFFRSSPAKCPHKRSRAMPRARRRRSCASRSAVAVALII